MLSGGVWSGWSSQAGWLRYGRTLLSIVVSDLNRGTKAPRN
jgi:hypothetical protein